MIWVPEMYPDESDSSFPVQLLHEKICVPRHTQRRTELRVSLLLHQTHGADAVARVSVAT